MSLTLADIYAGLGGTSPAPSALADVSIRRFLINSREAIPGCCFIALAGEHTDGHLYIGDAISRGAVAVLAQYAPPGVEALIIDCRSVSLSPDRLSGSSTQPVIFLVPNSLVALQQIAAYWRNRYSPKVIGITGSVGKTSTKELTASVLRQRFATLWNEGNLNNEIGLPLTLLRLESQHEFAVLEMGFYVEGEIGRLCELARPHIGVITNLGPIHLERAGSMEAIFRGKSELVQALPSDGWAVLNWDDDWVRKMAEISPAPVYRYGLTPEAELWADEITSEGLEGIRFRMHHRQANGRDEVIHTHLPLLGRHSVHTALRAAAVGLLCGLTWDDIIPGLRDVNAQVRIEVTSGISGSTLIDDTYNASPPSTIAALNLLADLKGRRVAVLGDMLELGAYEEIGHRLVGRRAADTVDVLVVVGQRARWIADEAAQGGLSAGSIYRVATTVDALPLLRELIAQGDYVLIKGSRAIGMESLVASLSVNVTA